MMKKLTIMMILLIMVVSLPMLSAGTQKTGEEKVNLRYALWDGGQKAAMEAAIKEFEAQNPNVNVDIELTEWNDYWTRITAGVAAKTMPDVFWGHAAYFASLASKGALLDLKPYIEKDGLDLSLYYEGLVDNWKYDGKQFGLSKDWDTICYAYNIDMMNEAGVDPTTWEWNPVDGGSFVEGLKKLTVDANGNNATDPGFDPDNVVRYGLGGITAGEIQTGWLPFVWMNGGPGNGILNEAYGKEFVMDNPKTVEALQFCADLINVYQVCPSAATPAFAGGAFDLFVAEKVAMYCAGPWTLGSARANATFDWDVAPLPKGPKGRITTFNGLAHNVAASTKYPEMAWKLASFLDGPEGQKIIAGFAVTFPSIKEAEAIYMDAFKGQAPASVHWYFDEAKGAKGPYPAHVRWAEINDAYNRELTSAFSGAISAAEAIENIKVDVEPLL